MKKLAKNALKYKAPQLQIVRVAEPPAGSQPSIRTPSDAAKLLEPLRYAAEEKFVCVLLDATHGVTGIIEVSHGTLSSSLVHPREVFKGALLANAHGILVAHNHPSGSRAASQDDLNTTKQLVEAGNILGVPVLDHLIMTPHGEPVSIRENFPEYWMVK